MDAPNSLLEKSSGTSVLRRYPIADAESCRYSYFSRQSDTRRSLPRVLKTADNDTVLTAVKAVPEHKHEKPENSPVFPGNYPVIRHQGGSTQLCAGLEAGIEGAMHAVVKQAEERDSMEFGEWEVDDDIWEKEAKDGDVQDSLPM